MDRTDLESLAESTILTVGLYAMFVFLLIAFNSYGPGLIFLPLGFAVAATVVLAGLFLPKFPLVDSPGQPEQVLARVAYEIRRMGLRVEERPGSITVRLGSTVAVRLHAGRSPAGSKIRYQAYATPAGWGTLVTLIVIVWTAPAGVGTQLYAFRKARGFARDVVAPFVRRTESATPSRPEDETQALLISGLSEAHRLAAEAYESLRSAYEDWLVLAGFSGVLVWGVIFAVLIAMPYLRPFAMDLLGIVAISTATGIVTAATLLSLVWRRVRPRLIGNHSWSERLHWALLRETGRAPVDAAQPSSAEILLDASKQIPSWLEARRRAGLSADQAADWVVFVVFLSAGWAFFFGLSELFGGRLLSALPGLASGLGLLFIAFLLWTHWKRQRDAAIARTREEWRRRMEAVQSTFDRFLKDL